jgi:hypothetical protein
MPETTPVVDPPKPTPAREPKPVPAEPRRESRPQPFDPDWPDDLPLPQPKALSIAHE